MNELLEELLQSVPRIDKIIWLGDFNARAGSEWPVVFWGGTSQVKWIATVSCFLNSALNFCFKLRVHNWKAKTGLHYIRQPWQAGYLHRKISKKYMPKCFWSLIQPLEISLLRSNLRAWSYIYANIQRYFAKFCKLELRLRNIMVVDLQCVTWNSGVSSRKKSPGWLEKINQIIEILSQIRIWYESVFYKYKCPWGPDNT